MARRKRSSAHVESEDEAVERRQPKPLWRVTGSLLVGLVLIAAYAKWQQQAALSRNGNAPPTTPVTGSAPANAAPAAVASELKAADVSHLPEIDEQGVDREVLAAIHRDRDLVRQQPNAADAWGNLGMTYHAHQFHEAAALCYAAAEKLAAKNAQWPYLLGVALRDFKSDEATLALRRAVQIAGDRPPAVKLMLCEVLLETGRLDEAEQALKSVAPPYPDSLRAALSQARLSAIRGDYQRCYGQLRTIYAEFERDPDLRNRELPVLQLLIETMQRLGKHDEAEQSRRAMQGQGSPAWNDPYMQQVYGREVGLKKQLEDGERFYRRREYEKSIDSLAQTLSTYPDSLFAKILLARALIRTGAPDSDRPDANERLQRAVDLLQNALRQDPKSVEALFRLAVARDYQGQGDESISLYRQAIAIKPDFTMAYFNLATKLWSDKQDGPGALEALEGAIQAEPDFVDGHYLLGSILMQLGRFTEAERHFETLVQLQPNVARFREALGRSRRAQSGAR